MSVVLLSVLFFTATGLCDDVLYNNFFSKCQSGTTCRGQNITDRQRYNQENYLNDMNCFCDVDCAKFGDRCHEVALSYEKYEYYGCLDIPEIETRNKVRLISACPVDWTDRWYKTRCETVQTHRFLRLPASGSVSGQNYRNIFCSICHGEKAILWNVQLSCRMEKYLNISHISAWNQPDKCRVNFIPPNGTHYRPCLQSVENCLASFNNFVMARKCKVGSISYVNAEHTTFKKVHCAICNAVNISDISSAQSHDSDARLPTTLQYSHTTIIDVNRNVHRPDENDGVTAGRVDLKRYYLCHTGAVYDIFYGRCRRLRETGAELPPMDRAKFILDQDTSSLNEPPTNIVYETFTNTNSSNEEVYELSTFDVDQRLMLSSQNVTNNGSYAQLWPYSYSPIVRWSCVMISNISLLLLLAIYTLLPELRNLPGKILIHLSSSLLLSNLSYSIFVLMIYDPTLCVVLATFTNSSALLSVFWTNVISFDIWHTFRSSSMKISRSERTHRRHLTYIAYAWGSTTFLTVASIIHGYCQVGMFIYGKGTGLSCFITNYHAIIVYYIAPTGALLVSNAVFFILTIASITRMNRIARKVQKPGNRLYNIIYAVKLSIIMGLTRLLWYSIQVINVLTTITYYNEIGYLVDALIGLQGVFIFITFVFTKKVFRLLKEKYKKGRVRKIATNTLTLTRKSGGEQLSDDKRVIEIT